MRFKFGASISLGDGKLIGRLNRVVIDLETKAITRLVIRIGKLITQDKVAPIDWVGVGEQDMLVLQTNSSQLAQMPDFGITRYRAADEGELWGDEERALLLLPPVYSYPPCPAMSIDFSAGQPDMRGTRVNIPDSAICVKQGAKVISADGKQVGRLERVLTSDRTKRATYVELCQGRLRKAQKLVPVEWVDQFDEGQVCLGVSARKIQELPE